jgi:hypothetical protein
LVANVLINTLNDLLNKSIAISVPIYGIHTGSKIYFWFCDGLAWLQPASPERANMPVQKQELRKNYIGVLSDGIDEQRAAEALAKSPHLMKDFFRGLIASVLIRLGEPNPR